MAFARIRQVCVRCGLLAVTELLVHRFVLMLRVGLCSWWTACLSKPYLTVLTNESYRASWIRTGCILSLLILTG